jgi:hypothetical protein
MAVGGGPVTDGGAADLTSAHDLAGPVGSSCSGDQRQCASNPVESQSCQSGSWVASRPCPTGDVSVLDAQCNGGYCAPPLGASPCDLNGGPSESYCFQQVSSQHSCQPFVDPQSKMVSWSCAVVVGSGASGAACSSGSQCRSGFCASNGVCFRPCSSTSDCPQHQPPFACKKVTIDVEGVTVDVQSCSP